MQKHFWAFALLFLPFLTFSQSASTTQYCWNFENNCTDLAHAFGLLCVPNAISTHGTPSLSDEYQSRHAHLYIKYENCGTSGNSVHSEGIALAYNFQAGVTYTVRFDAIGAGGITAPNPLLKFTLANGLANQNIPNNSGPYCLQTADLPPIPPSGMLVRTFTQSEFSNVQWTPSSLRFTPTQNFSQLWIYPEINTAALPAVNSEVNTFFSLDNICIQEACEDIPFRLSSCRASGEIPRINVKIEDINIPGDVPANMWYVAKLIDCNLGFTFFNTQSISPITFTGTNTFSLPADDGCYAVFYYKGIECQSPFVSQVINTNTVRNSCDNCNFTWQIRVLPTPNDPNCLPVTFTAYPMQGIFPPGLTFTATVNGEPAAVINNTVEVEEVPWGGSVKVCFTALLPGCDPVTRCITWYRHHCPPESGARDATAKVKQVVHIVNPSDQYIKILGMHEESEVQLFDLQGSLKRQVSLPVGGMIDVADLPNGQYLLSVRSGTSQQVIKVMILHQ